MEVLLLISGGNTDREIGDELFISIKTVGNHVSNILNKTGAANRAEAASFAALHGIVTEDAED
jgi:NarL family two-component system response regulator LiaR